MAENLGDLVILMKLGPKWLKNLGDLVILMKI